MLICVGNADLRSLRIDLADACLESGKMPAYGVFGGRAIRSWLYTLRSSGARGLDAFLSIDISLRWSEDSCYTVEALFANPRPLLNPSNSRFRQVSSHVFPFSRLTPSKMHILFPSSASLRLCVLALNSSHVSRFMSWQGCHSHV